jgi:flagellar hook-associated protein 1 FlgK
MGNPFSTLNSSLSGLSTSQRIAELAAKNVANATTEGYTRNRAEVQSATGSTSSRIHSVRNDVGDGVVITGVSRIRDELSETRSLVESARGSALNESSKTMTRIEGLITEPSDNGLAVQLNDFWNYWDDVANDPNNLGARAALITQGQTVSSTLNRTAASLLQLQGQTDTAVSASLVEANSYIEQIAKFNQVLHTTQSDGGALNDTVDQRDLLMEKLAKLTGATRTMDSSGAVNVTINGVTVVNGATSVALTKRGLAPGALPIEIMAGRTPVKVDNGSMGGMLQAINTTYPSYVEELDAVANRLWHDVNDLHRTGYGSGTPFDTTDGRYFFSPGDSGGAGTGATALTIGVSADVVGKPGAVSISHSAQSLDGGLAQDIAERQSAVGGASMTYQELIARLGVEAQNSIHAAKVQSNVVTQVDAERKGVSGVNVDEELVTLSQAQQAYAANARVISIIDEMLDTLINMVR